MNKIIPGAYVLSVTENGYGKLTPFAEYSAHGRGGKGVVCHAITEKTGLLTGIAAVAETDDVMMITNEGVMIRTPVSDVRVCGRASQGVIMMRLSEGGRVVNFAAIAEEEEATRRAEAAAESVDDDPLFDDETDLPADAAEAEALSSEVSEGEEADIELLDME